MATLRVFGMTVAAGLMARIASTNAQDTSATYVVSLSKLLHPPRVTRQPKH